MDVAETRDVRKRVLGNQGTMFALYHTFQLWLFPALIVASLTFAFVFYWTLSLWPGLIGHLFFNFFISMVAIGSLIVG